MIKYNCSKPKTTENPKNVAIKLAFIEHPKTSHKLVITIKQAKKVAVANILIALYILEHKSENFLNEKM